MQHSLLSGAGYEYNVTDLLKAIDPVARMKASVTRDRNDPYERTKTM